MVQHGVWCPQGCMVDKKGELRGTIGQRRTGRVVSAQPAVWSQFHLRPLCPGLCRSQERRRSRGDAIASRTTGRASAGSRTTTCGPGKRWPSGCVSTTSSCGRCPMTASSSPSAWTCRSTTGCFSWCRGRPAVVARVINYGLAHSWAGDRGRSSSSHTRTRMAVHRCGPCSRLIDARDGNRTDEVTDVLQSVSRERGPWVLPCMGSKPGALQGKPYTKQQLDDGKNAKTSQASRPGRL